MRIDLILLVSLLLISCGTRQEQMEDRLPVHSVSRVFPDTLRVRNTGRVVHVIVALCDNVHQGIVPVPARIGNGDDPVNNLYWGAAYGVKSYMRKQSGWEMLSSVTSPKPNVLERVVFRHRPSGVVLVADAYQGRAIREATVDLVRFAAGEGGEMVEVGPKRDTVVIGGGADLIAYVGHDGLMDFSLDSFPTSVDNRTREVIVLACASKRFFAEPLRSTGAQPLLWTTNLMAPEAYVLSAALDGWIARESGGKIRARAAGAYNRYQKCGERSALGLFATGW